MNVQRLKNLISLRTRNFSRRIQRALEELAENLQRESQQARQPQAVPIPVPVRNRNPLARRNYSTNPGFHGGLTIINIIKIGLLNKVLKIQFLL